LRQTFDVVLMSTKASLSSDDSSLSSWRSEEVLPLILIAKRPLVPAEVPAPLRYLEPVIFSHGCPCRFCRSCSYDDELVVVPPLPISADTSLLAVPFVEVDRGKKFRFLRKWHSDRASSFSSENSNPPRAFCSSRLNSLRREYLRFLFLLPVMLLSSSRLDRGPSSEMLESTMLESCCFTSLDRICFLLITTGGGPVATLMIVGESIDWSFTERKAICSSRSWDEPGGWDFDSFSLNSWILAEWLLQSRCQSLSRYLFTVQFSYFDESLKVRGLIVICSRWVRQSNFNRSNCYWLSYSVICIFSQCKRQGNTKKSID